MRPKKPTLRMCAGCRQLKPKSDLYRIVLSSQGAWVDETGKASGRGIYVCRDTECIAKMQKARRTRAAGSNAVPDLVFEQLRELTMDG